MFLNYIVTWLRNQRRQKSYSLLNITGLSFGLACVIIIFLYIQYELSYDRQHEHADRIYKVVKESRTGGYMGKNRFGVTPAPLAPALMDAFPEIEAATRLDNGSNTLIRAGDQVFTEYEWIWADNFVFKVFTFPLLSGDKATALKNKFSVVLSESMAEKYFGDENPMGKTMNYNNEYDFVVTGVMNDIPVNSHIRGDFIASFDSYRDMDRNMDHWGNSSYHTFILLKKGADPLDLEAKYPAFQETKYSQYDWWEKEKSSIWYHQKLTDLHLKCDTIFNFGMTNDIKYIYIYSAIAFFILLIACMNYMNLATARSAKRAREVGIRKVVGAQRIQLIGQFLGESLLLSFISLILAFGIAYLILPVFNGLVERDISMQFLWKPRLISILLGIGLFVGLISGCYPALFISQFKPVSSLKRGIGRKGGASYFRNILVVVQFSVSVILIISTLVVSKQLSFIRNKKLGFTRDHIIIHRIRDSAVREKRDVFRQELLKLPGITQVSYSSSLPMRVSSNTSLRYEGAANPDEDRLQTYFANVDYNYIDLFELEMVQGRKFIKEMDHGSHRYIINETAVERLGWTEPLGKSFGRKDRMGPIVGVVKDFHYANLHLPMEAVTFYLRPDYSSYLSIKLDTEDIQGTVSRIEDVWERFSSGYPFEFEFMDERYDKMYKVEIRLGKSFSYFSILAIVICCLGLFGLASFTTEQRTKEIGIRKVLGGSTHGIVLMLLRQFTKWVVVANVVGWPVAWFVMNKWLQDFNYRIDLGIWTFLTSAVLALIVALLTVSYQSIKVTLANPVDSLRYE